MGWRDTDMRVIFHQNMVFIHPVQYHVSFRMENALSHVLPSTISDACHSPMPSACVSESRTSKVAHTCPNHDPRKNKFIFESIPFPECTCPNHNTVHPGASNCQSTHAQTITMLMLDSIHWPEHTCPNHESDNVHVRKHPFPKAHHGTPVQTMMTFRFEMVWVQTSRCCPLCRLGLARTVRQRITSVEVRS